jgi:hypothetical protein
VEATTETFKGPKSSHDLLPEMRAASTSAAATQAAPVPPPAPARKASPPRKRAERSAPESVSFEGLRARESAPTGTSAEAKRIAELEARLRGDGKRASSPREKKKSRAGRSALEEMRSAYASGKKEKKSEKEALDALECFRGGLREGGKSDRKKEKASREPEEKLAEEEEESGWREYGASDEEADQAGDWRNHK